MRSQTKQTETNDVGHADDQSNSPYASRTLSSRLLIAGLFWAFCLILSAAGHRLYKATATLDRAVSVHTYQTNGVPLAWVGPGTAEDAHQRVAGATTAQTTGQLRALPNSRFWLGAAFVFSVVGGLMAWSGRWITNTGMQSLVGLFAGHLLWLGPIELGLDVAGRKLGLAGSLEVIGDRVVGTHAAGTLIQLSVVFLIPMLIGLTMHESNRCAVFQWFRRRLRNVLGPSASGRVENYAARTAIQFFMTVWFCYVGVLWLADPLTGVVGQVGLLLLLVAIVIATPYMIWRTAQQSSAARALRYSISGAIVAWTAVEIAASMRLFHEPWLSTSISSGVFLLLLSLVFTGLSARCLATGRPRTSVSPMPATATIAVLLALAVGCGATGPFEALTSAEIDQQLHEYDEQIEAPSEDANEALLHALASNDPEMRAQAATALGKSRRLSRVIQERLKGMANSDESRLSQLAAFHALRRQDLLSPELEARFAQLRSNESNASE